MIISLFSSHKKLLLALLLTAITQSQLTGMKRANENPSKQPPKKLSVRDPLSPDQSNSVLIKRIATCMKETGDTTLFYNTMPEFQEKIVFELIDITSYEALANSLAVIARLGLIGNSQMPIISFQRHFLEARFTPLQLTDYLYQACMQGDLNVLELLFGTFGSQYAQILCSSPDSNGWTAFHTAAYWNHLHIVRYFLTLTNALELFSVPDKQGDTVLHIAAASNNIDVIELILSQPKAHKLCTLKNNRGWTALHIAAYSGFEEIVELISKLPQASDLHIIENQSGKTAYDLACQKRHAKVIKLLQDTNLMKALEIL